MNDELNSIKSVFVVREHKLWYRQVTDHRNHRANYGYTRVDDKYTLVQIPSRIPFYYVEESTCPTGKYVNICTADLGFRALRVGDEYHFDNDCLKDVKLDPYCQFEFDEENKIIAVWQTADAQYYLVEGNAVLKYGRDIKAALMVEADEKNRPYYTDQKKRIAELYETAEFSENGRLVMVGDYHQDQVPKLKFKSTTSTFWGDCYPESTIPAETKSIIAKIKEWYRR